MSAVHTGGQQPAAVMKGAQEDSHNENGAPDSVNKGGGGGRLLTPTFATVHFAQSPGTASLTIKLQQPQVVAEVRCSLVS